MDFLNKVKVDIGQIEGFSIKNIESIKIGDRLVTGKFLNRSIRPFSTNMICGIYFNENNDITLLIEDIAIRNIDYTTIKLKDLLNENNILLENVLLMPPIETFKYDYIKYIISDKDNRTTKVKLTSGEVATCKCLPTDIFDTQKGIELAYYKAIAKKYDKECKDYSKSIWDLQEEITKLEIKRKESWMEYLNAFGNTGEY